MKEDGCDLFYRFTAWMKLVVSVPKAPSLGTAPSGMEYYLILQIIKKISKFII